MKQFIFNIDKLSIQNKSAFIFLYRIAVSDGCFPFNEMYRLTASTNIPAHLNVALWKAIFGFTVSTRIIFEPSDFV